MAESSVRSLRPPDWAAVDAAWRRSLARGVCGIMELVRLGATVLLTANNFNAAFRIRAVSCDLQIRSRFWKTCFARLHSGIVSGSMKVKPMKKVLALSSKLVAAQSAWTRLAIRRTDAWTKRLIYFDPNSGLTARGFWKTLIPARSTSPSGLSVVARNSSFTYKDRHDHDRVVQR